MAEKRNITKDDIFLEARLRAEGARIEVRKAPAAWSIVNAVVLDGCETVIGLWPNPASRLDAIVDGDDVVISEMGEVLGAGKPEPRASWRDKLMRDGTTVDSAISQIIPTNTNIIMRPRCAVFDSGKGCRYCGIFAATKNIGPASRSDTLKTTERNVEAAIIAVQCGWRGTILLTGGTHPPSKRGQLTDDFERIMTQFRESLDEDTLSQLHIAPEVFPPDDLADLYRWKDLGINATQFDSQVMDPDYFKAICPGRGDQNRWIEAQTAAVEVFGRGRGSTTDVVMGIEPMAGLLEGIEERIKRGVYTLVQTFMPAPGSPMAGMRPPSAEWIVKASEKIADIYMRYADTLDVDLTEDNRWGPTKRGQSFYATPSDDELTRRLQEMGKLPAGLPKQDGIELT